ncbi:MAG TPA: glycosyltransferase [Gemmataceae bacterium]|nr:glycosyltransferase [Gemmataceae bacterium]
MREKPVSRERWLEVEFTGAVPAGRWVRLIFATSFFDPLYRPLLRCVTAEGHEDAILPGALFGRGIWVGKIPDGTREVLISPGGQAADFVLEKVEVVSRLRLLGVALRRNPLHALAAIGARLAGLRFTADIQLRRALAAPLRDYGSWRADRLRELDRRLEAPRPHWQGGPHIAYVVDLTEKSKALAWLERQPYPNWSLVLVGAEPGSGNADDPVIAARAGEPIDEISLPGDSLISALRGEAPAYALGVAAEAALRDPHADIFYGDEDYVDAHGRRVGVALRPDWSPRLQSAQNYLGEALFFRMRAFRDQPGLASIEHVLRAGGEIAERLARDHKVCHIRRVLLTRTSAERPAKPKMRSVRSPTAAYRASIILPTRNRRDLLKSCLESLEPEIARHDLEVIVIDNDSREEATIRFLSSLSADRRFRVLSCPGKFNFSTLCNEGAGASSAPILLFLNNDTELPRGARLDALLQLAQEPGVGAVGAKLIFPNGRVQHAGVVLGMDNYTGHFERGLARDDPGYFGRLNAAYEVSAVTGACLAIEKQKFEAVGGFDPHLAVEFGDVDLCLRLAERGWQTICAGDCVLIHREARSRGLTLRPQDRYRTERLYFQNRWLDRIRDDPYFHPALSLDSLGARLG